MTSRELLERLGIQFPKAENQFQYPLDSEVEKVQALYDLIGLWVAHEVGAKNLEFNPGLAGPADDFLKDWVQESMEEFLFG